MGDTGAGGGLLVVREGVLGDVLSPKPDAGVESKGIAGTVALSANKLTKLRVESRTIPETGL